MLYIGVQCRCIAYSPKHAFIISTTVHADFPGKTQTSKIQTPRAQTLRLQSMPKTLITLAQTLSGGPPIIIPTGKQTFNLGQDFVPTGSIGPAPIGLLRPQRLSLRMFRSGTKCKCPNQEKKRARVWLRSPY